MMARVISSTKWVISSTKMLVGRDHLGNKTSCINPSAATFSNTPLHNPTPRTGIKNRFVPCVNSSLLLILVSGSRCAILTPSPAFLLCALKKNRTTSILKWENIGTEITPPCFYRTRVRSLAMLVTNSLTDCRLGNLIDVVTVIDVGDEKQFTP